MAAPNSEEKAREELLLLKKEAKKLLLVSSCDLARTRITVRGTKQAKVF
jgi:hypothetical protein